MKFKVVWHKKPKDDLAAPYLRAVDKRLFTAWANEAEKLLSSQPVKLGESRSGTKRIYVHGTLTFQFHLNLDDLKVVVVDFSMYPDV